MAIIYSYPIATPKSKDLLVGTSVFDENDPSSERTNPTVSFTVQSLINLIGPIIGTPNLQQVTGAGNTTTNSITIANSLSVNGSYIDSYGQSGSNGEVLTSQGTGTQTRWLASSGGVTSITPSDSTFITITQNATVGAITTTSALSAAGLGATPAIRETQYLRGDNTWAVVSTGTTYQAGAGLTLDTSTSPDTFKVDYLGTDNIILSAGTAVTPVGGDTIIINDATTGNVVKALISGLPFDNYDKWVLTGDSGTQDILSGNTVDIAGGTYITTAASATDTLTITHDATTRPANDTSGVQPDFGATFTAIDSITTNSTGHVTLANLKTITIPSNPVFIGPADANTDGIIGIVPAPAKATFEGGYFLRQDATWVIPSFSPNFIPATPISAGGDPAENGVKGLVSAPLAVTSVNPTSYFVNSSNLFSIPTGTGVISETVGVGDATVINTPLTAVIDSAARSLTLSSKKYKGGGLVGYVPEGGTTSTYLKGDGSWAAIPTGLIFKGTWAASTTAVVNGALTASVDLVIATADAEIVVGTVVEGVGITGTVRVDTVVSTTEFTLDTAITISDAITLTMSPPGGLSPNIIGLTPADGWLYIVSVAGKAEPNSADPWTTGTAPNSWNIGDWCVYNGTAWTLVPSSTAGVTTVDTTDGTYIDLTPTSPTGGNVTITADLNATADGTSTTTTKFLTEGNKWQVPSYTTDEDTLYILAGAADASVATNYDLILSADGSPQNTMVFKQGTNVTLTRAVNSLTINATDTDTNTTYDYLAVGSIPNGTVNSPPMGTGYSSAINVATTGGSGTGMTVDTTVVSGGVQTVTINNPGTGYAVGDNNIVISGGDSGAIMSLSGTVGETNPNLRLIDSAFAFNDVKITGTNATTITRTSDNGITINSDHQTLLGTGSNNSDSGIILNESGGTVKILGDGTYITAAQSGNTITLTGVNTTYTAGNGLNLSGTVFSADINNTQANSATTALSATAGRFYAVQLDNNATIADADLVVNIPWTNTQNTYTAGAGLDLSSFEFSAKIDTTAADDDTVALSATANRFYAVQLDNNSTAADRKMVVNIPWTSGGSYNWILDADSSGTTRTVASGDTVDFTGGTGISVTHSTTGTTTGVDFTNTGVIELNMPNTGPGEGGILLSANTGTIDIGIDYIGGNNIISTAYAGSGTVPTAAHILWADTAAAAASRKVFYSPVSDLPFSNKTGTVTGISASNQGVVVSTSATAPTIGINYAAATSPNTNLISTALSSAITVPDDDEILILKSSGSAVGTVERTKVSKLNFTNNSGTVTSVGGTGTVSGLTLTGTVTTSGDLTLGGTLSLTSANVTDGLGYTPYNNTNPSGFTSNTGTVTSVGTGSGLSGGAITTTGTISVDYSVATDNIILGADDQETVDIPTNARIMYADSTNAVRYAFVADLPFSSSTGDISGVTAGVALSGGGTSGTVTLNVRYAGTSSVIFSATDATGTDIDSDDVILYTDSEGATVNYGSVSDLNFLSNTTTTITTAQANAIVANTAKVSDTGVPAILSNGTTPTLNTGITAAEVRTLIGAGTGNGNGDVTLTGTQTLTNKTLTTPVINRILPSAGLLQIDGAGSVDGGIKLMCSAGSHGQTLKSQPHSASVTNTMLLPAGANSTLVAETTSTLAGVTGRGATTSTACSFTNTGAQTFGSGGSSDVYLGNAATNKFIRFHTNNINTYFDMNCGFVYWRQASSIRFEQNMTNGTFTASGDVVAFGSPSDERLKENIKPIESALDKAMKLQGVTFDWKKSDSILSIKKDIGFIAQDVKKVAPELVRENEDGYLSMRHQGIAPILLEAIKELKQEIEELKLNKCNCNK